MRVNKLAVMAFIAFSAMTIITMGVYTFWGELLRDPQMGLVGQPTFLEANSARLMSLGTPEKVDLGNNKEHPVIMNDPSIQKNWGLMGTGGASDIRVNRAWNITQGDRHVVVAVIDTGVDMNHPDLRENLWRNPGETGLDTHGRDKATNGIDDDGNGFVDDVYGYDFVNKKGINDVKSSQSVAKDHHGHGTHVAGIIGAVGGNNIGISGVCPKVSLMILKYFDPISHNNDNLKNTVRAVRYAVANGAQIINYSGGGIEPNEDEKAAIMSAREKGILFVAAAGNEKSNSDTSHYYPADYGLDNIISVTAINPDAQVLASSNYGVKTVHIAAPGEGIYSTLPDGAYGFMTGTSQATGFVTGVAALLFAQNRDFNYLKVKRQILSTADEISTLRDKTMTSGKLNSYAALAIQPLVPATGVVAIEPRSMRKSLLFGEGPSGVGSSNVNGAESRSAAAVSTSATSKSIQKIIRALAEQAHKQREQEEASTN